MQQELETLKKWIDNSDNIVFFGGAGVSTESGIPDFRSVDGLYNQQYDYPPETSWQRTSQLLPEMRRILRCQIYAGEQGDPEV